MLKPFVSKSVRIIFLLMISGHALSGQVIPDTNRFADEINQFIGWDKKNSFPQDAVLFVGSSSIRLWMTHDYFPEYPVINRGFGGSQIADVNTYLEYTVLKYHPAVIVFYAGDNDIAGGKSAETVFGDFMDFVKGVRKKLLTTQIIYLPVKPSPSRWQFWPVMQRVNAEIKKVASSRNLLFYVDTALPMLGTDGKPRTELFREDGLHLNEKGYQLWSDILLPFLNEAMKKD